MVKGFDRIVLAVPDLGAAVGQYHTLFGTRAQPMGEGHAWLGLPNTVLVRFAQGSATVAMIHR